LAQLLTINLKGGSLRYKPTITEEELDEKEAQFSEKNPEPIPPKRPWKSSDLKSSELMRVSELSRNKGISFNAAEAEILESLGELEDVNDEVYKRELSLWQSAKFIYMQSYVASRTIVFEVRDYGLVTIEEAKQAGVMGELMASSDYVLYIRSIGEIDFYSHIVNNSFLRWESIWEEAKSIGYTRNGKMILEAVPRNSAGEKQPLSAILASAASKFNLTVFEAKELPAKKQAMLVAQYLSQAWSEHFAYEDAKDRNK